MELSSSNIKKFLKFSYISGSNFSSLEKKKKKIYSKKTSYTSGNGSSKKISYIFFTKRFSIFPETETPRKKIIFQETESLKTFYISGNGTFFYFWKRVFRTLAYLELEAYSKPWYI